MVVGRGQTDIVQYSTKVLILRKNTKNRNMAVLYFIFHMIIV